MAAPPGRSPARAPSHFDTRALLLLFDADLKVTPASLTSIVALDNNGRNKLHLINTILPIVFGIAGAIALIAGILLSRGGRPTMEDELDAMS